MRDYLESMHDLTMVSIFTLNTDTINQMLKSIEEQAKLGYFVYNHKGVVQPQVIQYLIRLGFTVQSSPYKGKSGDGSLIEVGW